MDGWTVQQIDILTWEENFLKGGDPKVCLCFGSAERCKLGSPWESPGSCWLYFKPFYVSSAASLQLGSSSTSSSFILTPLSSRKPVPQTFKDLFYLSVVAHTWKHVILAHRKPRQKECEFKASLGCIARPLYYNNNIIIIIK